MNEIQQLRKFDPELGQERDIFPITKVSAIEEVDNEPTFGSENLVKSGGVYEQYNIKSELSLDNSSEGYCIYRSGESRLEASSRSIAYFNIEGLSKIRIFVPKTGNEYACVFSFCGTNNATTFIAPTNIVSVIEEVNYSQEIDLSVENPGGEKYIAITFTTSNGNPKCYLLKNYAFKEETDSISEELKSVSEELNIGFYEIKQKFKPRFIEQSTVGYTLKSSSNNESTVAFYDIQDKENILVHIPYGNIYSSFYAYSEEIIDNGSLIEPETYIVGITSPIDFVVKNTGNHKYLALIYISSYGAPIVRDKNRLEIIESNVESVEEQLETVEDFLGHKQIALDTSYTLKYITYGNSPQITTSASASVAYFYIKDKHNLIVHIPKCGNEYSQCYAYSETIKQSGTLIIGESIIKGNSSTKDFIVENSSNCNYLVLCYIPGSGVPTVSEPNTIENLIDTTNELSYTDKRIVDSIAANKKSDVYDKVRPLKVLFIANSFAVQATQNLPNIFSKIGYNIIIGVSYLGGGTVSQYDSLKESTTNTQYVKYNGTEWVYESLQTSNLNIYDPSHTYTTIEGNNHCKYDVNGGTNYVAYRCIQQTTGTFDPSCWVRATKSNSLIDKLNDENWDAVFFIQGSASAGLYSTYEPYFTSLLNWLPKRIQSLGYKVGWFMPWAWTDAKISNEGGNLDGGINNAEMYTNICNATQSNVINHETEITFFCPCGTATENQLNYYTQDQIWADGQHTNLLGFYPATLVLFDRLANYFCKTGLTELSYSSGIGISAEEAFNKAKTSALNAISTPYETTLIN